MIVILFGREWKMLKFERSRVDINSINIFLSQTFTDAL